MLSCCNKRSVSKEALERCAPSNVELTFSLYTRKLPNIYLVSFAAVFWGQRLPWRRLFIYHDDTNHAVLSLWDQIANIPYSNSLICRDRLISLLRQKQSPVWHVNGRYLTILVGCLRFRGKQTLYLTVKEGGPLPFAYDILTTALHYGNRVFVEYPENIPDYFKQSFPKGYTWERSLIFEDGGICIARSDIK